MGLKDKLGKAGKKTAGNATKTANKAANTAANSVDAAVQKTANQFDDIKTDIKTDVKANKKAEKTPLLKRGKKKDVPKAKKVAKPVKGKDAKAKSAAPDNKRLKLLIGLLSLLLLGLLGYAASLFLNPASEQKKAMDSAQATMAETAPVKTAEPVTTNDTQDAAAVSATAPSASSAPADTNTDQVPSASATTPASADVSKLPETITEPLPSDQTVAAEELDQLQDERDQMTEQEQLIQEQLEALEQMEKLKAERIAILEKRLAEQAAN